MYCVLLGDLQFNLSSTVSGIELNLLYIRCVNMEVRVDDALAEVGDFGRYQILLTVLLMVTIAFPGAFIAFGEVFISAVPDHWCKVPQQLQHLPIKLQKNLSIPKEFRDGALKFHRCEMYDADYNQVIDQLDYYTQWGPNATWKTKKCDNGWEYDHTYYDSTTATTFDLVCDSDWQPLFAVSLFYAGSLFGSVISGWITDKYGRYKAFFINTVFTVLLPIISAFSPSFEFYTAMRFLIGFTFPAVFQIPFILGMEIIGKKYRTAIAMLASGSWGISTCLLGGIASLTREWKSLILITTIPFVLIFTYWWILTESPRWLIAQKRYSEAEEILQKFARINRKKVAPNIIARHSSPATKKEEEQNFHPCVIYKTPNMRKKMIIINLIWVINAIIYIVLSYMSAKLGISDYLAFSIFGLVEAPSCLLAWYAMEKWGRRSTTLVAMIIVGLVCMINTFVPEDYTVLTVILPTIGKFFITGTFSIIYVFAGELLPTVVRGSGLALMSIVSALTLVPSPYILYLIVYNRILPLVVMGVMALVGGVAGIFLPETLGINLPQTLEEGEAFGKDMKILSFLPNRSNPSKGNIQNGKCSEIA